MIDIQKLEMLAKAATPQDFDSAEEKIENGYIECPHCGGQGEVEMEADYCNYDNAAIGVQFYGIGNEFGAAEAYYRAANPTAVLQLIAELQGYQQGAGVEAQAADEARAEVRRLKAENENLRDQLADNELQSRADAAFEDYCQEQQP